MKRLTKSRTDKVFFGVCGGLGRYFDIDPVIIRVIFVVLLFLGLTGLLIYIIMAVIMPEDEGVETTEGSDGPAERTGTSPERRREALAAILIVGGLVILLSNLGVFGWFRWNVFWPLVLIAIGAAIILQRYRSAQ